MNVNGELQLWLLLQKIFSNCKDRIYVWQLWKRWLTSQSWYEWVYFRQKTATFSFQKEELGICLGPNNNDGNDICQWVLQKNGQVVPRRTLRRLRLEELTITNETEVYPLFNVSFSELINDIIYNYKKEKPQTFLLLCFNPINCIVIWFKYEMTKYIQYIFIFTTWWYIYLMITNN